jgi:hypothetical protein
MTDVTSLVRRCEAAARLGARALEKVREARLSPEEQALLVGASNAETLRIQDLDQSTIPLVRAGDSVFSTPQDPESCARYFEAFKSLCDRGYVQYQSESSFALTWDGVARARKVAADKEP